MIKVCFADISDGFDGLIKSCVSYLPKEVISRSKKFHHQIDSYSFLMGRIILARSMQEWVHYVPMEEMEYTLLKKPYFQGTFKFNISHSGPWVICATSFDNEMGIDIEMVEEIDFHDFSSLFSESEWDLITNSKDPLRKFYECWTIKEAVSKADGKGLQIDFKKIRLVRDHTDWIVDHWVIKKIPIDESVFCHIASERDPGVIKLYKLTPENNLLYKYDLF